MMQTDVGPEAADLGPLYMTVTEGTQNVYLAAVPLIIQDMSMLQVSYKSYCQVHKKW